MRAKKPGRPRKKEGQSILISFRLAPELVSRLEAMAKKETSETGSNLSASGYARRLLIQVLKKDK